MKKYRIAFTVHIGIDPCCSIKERILKYIPEKFKENGYNIKFKKLHSWNNLCRVHMSVRMTEEEIQEIFDQYKKTYFYLYDTSYKLINKHF